MTIQRIFWLALVVILTGNSQSSQATSYVPLDDNALYRQSPVIVFAKIVAHRTAYDKTQAITEYTLQVRESFKGAPNPEVIRLTVPGGLRADGVRNYLWGAPHFTDSEQVLLFLQPQRGGSYRIMQFMLGAFHAVLDSHGRSVAFRDLANTVMLKNNAAKRDTDAAENQEFTRDLDDFMAWLRNRPGRPGLRQDYWVRKSAVERWTPLVGHQT